MQDSIVSFNILSPQPPVTLDAGRHILAAVDQQDIDPIEPIGLQTDTMESDGNGPSGIVPDGRTAGVRNTGGRTAAGIITPRLKNNKHESICDAR